MRRFLPAVAAVCCFAPLWAQTDRGVVEVYSSGVVVVGTTYQYQVYVGDITPNTVTWSVNDILGGNPTIGTITAAGLYTAPPIAPTPNIVTVKATSTVKPTKFGAATVTVQQPTPWVWGVSPNPVITGPITLNINGAGFVPGAVARLGGVNLKTTYISPTALTATGTATPAQIGTINVTVANPDPGGVVSQPKAVTVKAAPVQVTVTVSPNPASVQVGTSKQFTATVTGTSNTAVSWRVNDVAGGNSVIGTIDATGLYAAPATLPNSTIVYVRAISLANTSVSGNSQVTLQPAPGMISVSISPTSANVALGASQPFTATVTGTMNTAVTWSVNGMAGGNSTVGTVSAAGSYQAPMALPNPATVTVTATSSADTTKSASAAVTLTSAGTISVTISPVSASVAPGATQPFTATVTGSTNTAVVWLVNGVQGGNSTVGTISAAGSYQAPAAPPSPATVTVKATSVADTTKSASASVTVTAPSSGPAITSITPNPVIPGAFTLTINGSGFVSGAQASFGGVALTTQFVSAGQVTANGATTAAQAGTNVAVVVTNPGAVGSPPFNLPVAGGPNLVSSAVAARFLEQAAFGPTPAAVAHVQQVGLQGYLNEQFNTPASPLPDPNSNFSAAGPMQVRFFTNAVNGPDQLRQRVAFALSEIFVISINKLFYQGKMIPYFNMLANDAFGNYLTLMKDVTLSPAMGEYLDMVNNDKPNPALGTLANENYAREQLQLFTIGTYALNPDGTLQKDGLGNPIFTYDQHTIQEFARVLTGWTYPTQPGDVLQAHNHMYYFGPMEAYAPNHDAGSKTLLNGQVLPAGQPPAKDLDDALGNIFNHPNVGPFVSKQLIQHLVMSNPSPAYVQRVAAVFNNNGSGVRGDLKAVVSAILLDAEARQGDPPSASPATGGHLREPVLYMIAFLRAMGAAIDDTNYLVYDATLLSQIIYNSPSVFNYYSPQYGIPGTTLLGPEFQLQTPTNAIGRANWIYQQLYAHYASNLQAYGIDLTSYVNLAGNPAQLVDAVDNALTGGQMPAQMKSYIASAVSGTTGNLDRAQTAIYLTATSSFYQAQH